jgi:hypothetical protein
MMGTDRDLILRPGMRGIESEMATKSIVLVTERASRLILRFKIEVGGFVYCYAMHP